MVGVYLEFEHPRPLDLMAIRHSIIKHTLFLLTFELESLNLGVEFAPHEMKLFSGNQTVRLRRSELGLTLIGLAWYRRPPESLLYPL